MSEQGAPGITTRRLVLRRARVDDLDDYVRVHSDPRTYSHSPHTMPTPQECRDRLAADLDDWDTLGIGYAAVVDRESGDVIGWAGLRHKDSDDGFFNLYFRLGSVGFLPGASRQAVREALDVHVRILLGGMVGIVRRELPWVELLRLEYRDGLGSVTSTDARGGPRSAVSRTDSSSPRPTTATT